MRFVNEQEYHILTANKYEIPTPYILKCDKDGAVYVVDDKRIECEAPKVSVINTHGAGEILAAVFLCLKARGVATKKSLQTAVKIASYSTEQVGILHLANHLKVKRLLYPIIRV